ncbi:MAG: hypothetical protein MK010_11195 [Erythrobacter sp.]|nr:hypothetical protein [Erythrobacter sp.]
MFLLIRIVAAIASRTALLIPALALAALALPTRGATAVVLGTRAIGAEDSLIDRFDPGKRCGDYM